LCLEWVCNHTLEIVIAGMKQSTLQQHKEATMLCEEGMTTIEASSALLVP
jgi:hypothetical protein